MYSLEEKKKKKKRWEIIVLVLVLTWSVFFLIDYIRYQNSNHPLIVINKKTKTFDDGTVTEYYSLGYIYREYKRRAIGEIELVPIWKKMKNPEAIADFPITYTDYNVPDNPAMEKKYKGLLYFYQYDELIGTYKCLNTKTACNNAQNGDDGYNINEVDEINKLAEQPIFYMFDEGYAFIEDSLEQTNANKKQFKKTIYLFDVKNNKIIGEYSDIRYSIINEETGYAESVDNNFIVMNSKKKWGLINVKDGVITEVLPFEYESINYNERTGFYIIKKDKWSVINLETKEETQGFDDMIVDLHPYNNKLVALTAKEVNGDYLYNTSYIDGKEILGDLNIIHLSFQDNFLIYVNDKFELFITDYEGKKLVDKNGIVIYFDDFYQSNMQNSAYKLEFMIDNTVNLVIPRKKELNCNYDVYTISLESWEVLIENINVPIT